MDNVPVHPFPVELGYSGPWLTKSITIINSSPPDLLACSTSLHRAHKQRQKRSTEPHKQLDEDWLWIPLYFKYRKVRMSWFVRETLVSRTIYSVRSRPFVKQRRRLFNIHLAGCAESALQEENWYNCITWVVMEYFPCSSMDKSSNRFSVDLRSTLKDRQELWPFSVFLKIESWFLKD